MQRGYVPTTSEVAQDLSIARSTAWLLNQRLMLCASLLVSTRVPASSGLQLEVPVRRPRRTPPMTSTAPDHVRAFHADHLAGRHRTNRVTIAIDTVGRRTYGTGVPLTEHEIHHDPRPAYDPWDHPNIYRWLRYHFVGVHRTVSLRWLPRWLGAFLAGWNSGNGGAEHPSWCEIALQCPPWPLRDLDPWRGPPPQAWASSEVDTVHVAGG
jgi:hypothetical protein